MCKHSLFHQPQTSHPAQVYPIAVGIILPEAQFPVQCIGGLKPKTASESKRQPHSGSGRANLEAH